MTPAFLPLGQAIAVPLLADAPERTLMPSAPADLNPFGTVFLILSWLLLLGLNAWCFRKVLSGGGTPSGATSGAPRSLDRLP